MSLLCEESPNSDSKMDISEVTTDSAGISPIAEDEMQQHKEVDATPPRLLNGSMSTIENHNAHNDIQKQFNNYEHNENAELKTETASIAEALDNRTIRPEILELENFPQRQIITTRTLANSHPLMSPTHTDSDSEQYTQSKCINFPDVIPRTEHLSQSTIQQEQPPQHQQLLTQPMRNSFNKHKQNKPQATKISLLRAHSPDLLSSESDDVSQYLAAVESNFQAVALVPNCNANLNKTTRKNVKRLIGVVGCEDISSLDSISNHSFDDDEDIEHNLASLSPSSSLMDGLDGVGADDNGIDDDDDDDDIDCEGPELLSDNDDEFNDFGLATTPTPNNAAAAVVQVNATNVLPQYTAAEERRDSRNWQKITLTDGTTREIDMRVIEPYKRVLSHGGYLKAGGQNAIVIFCACHLPDKSRADYSYVMDNLFLYVVKTLEQLITDDYVLIYLHGGSNRRNMPPFPWLKRCYQLLDRRLRKSLKHMYLVHPTFWIKSLVWMARPFVSTKFWRKLIYVKSLKELGSHIAVEKAAIPDKVKQYDAKRH